MYYILYAPAPHFHFMFNLNKSEATCKPYLHIIWFENLERGHSMELTTRLKNTQKININPEPKWSTDEKNTTILVWLRETADQSPIKNAV